MVSMRSLTPSFCPIVGSGGTGGGRVGVMWFRRDLRLGDNPALLDAVADGPVLPLFVLDPALWGPAGPSRRGYLGASLRALDGQLRQRRTRALASSGAIRCAGSCSPRRRSAPTGSMSPPTSAPTARAATRRSSARSPTPGSSWCAPVRPTPSRPGRVRNGPATPTRSTRRSRRRGPSTAGALRSTLRPAGRWAGARRRHHRDPRAGAARRARAARGRRSGRPATVARSSCRTSATTTTCATTPAGTRTSRMSVHLKYGEIHPRTMLADLAPLRSTGAATYRKELAWREFYADVLHAKPESARHYLRPEYAGMPYDEPGRSVRGLAARPHRLPDRRRRDASAAAHRMDAQPGPDDRGQLPGQGPAPRVAARRPPLHAVARRRGPRLQPARLAVDGRLRHRRRRRTSGSSTPPGRAGSSTHRATTSDAGSTSLPTPTSVPDPHEPDDDVRRRVGYPAPIVDHAEERREALARWEQIRA